VDSNQSRACTKFVKTSASAAGLLCVAAAYTHSLNRFLCSSKLRQSASDSPRRGTDGRRGRRPARSASSCVARMTEGGRPLITETLLQELLLALLGFFGDVFVDSAPPPHGDDRHSAGIVAVLDPAVCTVRVAPHIDWVAPPDRFEIVMWAHECSGFSSNASTLIELLLAGA